jgi:hypothetical protein
MKMNRLIPSAFLLFALAAGSVAWYMWWTLEPTGMMPLVSERDVPYAEFALDPDSAAVVDLPTGTRLTFPAHAFRRADGSEPDAVALSVREFTDAESILRAGVPMGMGEASYLESAGMLEVRAFEEGEELQLAEDVIMGVELASNREAGDGFQVWTLDESDWGWQGAGDFERSDNFRRQAALDALDSALVPPVPGEVAERFEFQLYGDRQNAPHLKPWNGVTWELVGDDAQAAQRLLRSAWTDAKVQARGDGTYDLIFSYEHPQLRAENAEGNGKVHARPQLKGRKLRRTEEAYAEALVSWEAELENRKAERDLVAAQGKFLYTFGSGELGYINIDALKRMDALPLVDLHFDCEKDLRLLDRTVLFMVLLDQNSVIRFPAHEWSSIPLPEGRVQLVLPLEDGTMRWVDDAAFEGQIRSRATAPGTIRTLNVTTQPYAPSDLPA